MFQKLEEVEAHFQDIELRLQSPDAAANQAQFQKLSKEHSSLLPLVHTYREFKKMKQDFAQNEQIIREDSGELKQMALEENKELEGQLAQLERKLKVLLLPKDPNDDKNILLEIRAGAGGDEAGIFAGELFRMYSKYAEKMGWQVEVMSGSANDVGGFKEVISHDSRRQSL